MLRSSDFEAPAMTDSDTNKPQPLRLRMLPNDSGMMTEMREELRRRGAPTSGRYEELVARLDALVVAEVEADAIDDGVGGLSRESLFLSPALSLSRSLSLARSLVLQPRVYAEYARRVYVQRTWRTLFTATSGWKPPQTTTTRRRRVRTVRQASTRQRYTETHRQSTTGTGTETERQPRRGTETEMRSTIDQGSLQTHRLRSDRRG